MKRLALFIWLLCVFLLSCSQSASIHKETETPEIPTGEPILVIEPQGHSATIGDVIFTPDGSTLISVSEDKTIRLWDVETGELLRTFRGRIDEGDSGVFHAGALSPDGRILAVTGFFMKPMLGVLPVVRRIRLFDLETGEQIGLSHKRYTWYLSHAIAFSNDGRWLATGCEENVVEIWHISETGELNLARTLRHTGNVRDVAFSPDGTKLVATSYGGTMHLWELPQDLKGFKNLSGLSYTEMKQHTAAVRCVAYSPDGQYIVSGGNDGKILLWDGSGIFLKEIDQYPGFVATVSFSSDSKKIVASGEENFHAVVYTIPSGEKITTFRQHTNSVVASAFCGTEWIATAGGDNNEIYIWNASSGTVKTYIVGQGKRVVSVAFGKGLNIGFGNTWGEGNGARPLEKSFDFSEMFLDQNPPLESDFRRIRTTYRGHTLKHITPYKLHVTGGGSIESARDFGGRILSYTFTNAGEVIIGTDQFLKRYRKDGTFLHWFGGHTGPAVWAVALSGDGRILASAGDDQRIRLWNLVTGEHLASLFVTVDDEWICWTPQGYYAASAGGEKYIGWHLNQGEHNAAKFYPVSDFRERFHKPRLVKRTIELGSFEEALKESKLKKAKIADVLPPEVQWISPRTYTSQASQSSIRVRAKIYSDSKITEVKPLINGRPPVSGRGLKIGDYKPAFQKETVYQKEIDWIVPLKAGRNKIAFYVENENASDTSDERMVVYSTSEEGRQKDVYMVSIGISTYQRSGLQLEYADDDARAMSQLFRRQKGRLYRNVIIKELYDKQATYSEVINALEWLRRKATTYQDVALVFIAAHGYNDQGKFFILPADGEPDRIEHTGVSWQTFSEILGNLPARVLLFLDTCHSGQLGQDLYVLGKKVDNTEAIRRLASDDYGVVILAASTGREFSMEHPDWGHGAFTKALLEALEQGQADYSGDGIIHLRELDLYVAERVEALTNGSQHPTTQKPSTISRFPVVQISD